MQYNEDEFAYYLGNSENPYLILIKVKSIEIQSIVIRENPKFIDGNAFSYCNSLTSITFIGTIEQWQSISKETRWRITPLSCVVHCTDGDINI